MALTSGLPRKQISSTKLCLETNNKNGQDKSILRKTAIQVEEKTGKFTSVFTKNFENILKSNDTILQTRKPSIYEQMTNYDVRFVLNKLIAAVEASLNAEKISSSTNVKNIVTALSVQRKEEIASEKVDSAYVIPIFEVTSTIPNESKDKFAKRTEAAINRVSKVSPNFVISTSGDERANQSDNKQQFLDTDKKNLQRRSQKQNISLQALDNKNSFLSTDLLPLNQNATDSTKQIGTREKDFQTRKPENDHPGAGHSSPKNKRLKNNLPSDFKHPGPFVKTKQHVLTLARLLSLNYEKILKNSFRIPTCKKKLPGKITIPPTFDPNNPPTTSKKQQEEKKELLIFPTVSVSENKEKIEKKIEKIKKAALNKNIIIRSDSKTRMRIEKYIRSQVKKIQDLVCEEQRSLHGSLEHLDEQSLRDMSEMYYCAFGSENTDSGIANTEDDEYFCFFCSKPNGENGVSALVDSVLESIKKGNLYTSSHLHIPRGKDPYTTNSNMEFGTLSKCKSEIEFPTEYLNYISSNKLDINKRISKQQIQRNDIGNTKYFLTMTSRVKPSNSNLRILRSASDSVGLHLSKNTFDVLKLNDDEDRNDAIQNYKLFPHFLEQTSNWGNHSQMGNFEIQSSASNTTGINTAQMLQKDDGIGDSNDSFQSYIEALENNIENESAMSNKTSSQKYINFMKDDSVNNQRCSTKLFEFHPRNNCESNYDELERQQGAITEDILDSEYWISDLDKENGFIQHRDKNRNLRRRNTITCVRDKSETGEDLKYDQNRTEFENYLWKAYKEHLLENYQNDTEYSSSPNLNYYSLDRKAKFKHRDCKSMDYINGENNDFLSKNFAQSSEQETNQVSSTLLKNILKNSSISKCLPGRFPSRQSRTKSICNEIPSDCEADDVIRRLREERKLSFGNMTSDIANGPQSAFSSQFLKDLEKRDRGRKTSENSNQRRFSKSSLSNGKRSKSEYKKSFLQLLALKRIQEAEKELDKAPTNELPSVEDENSGSLLEALKTHGYKTVISQRFQDTDNDLLDSFHMNYLKSPRNLRAELARLNYMYYESLPRYNLDPCEESNYLYEDLDYSRNMLNGLATPYFYDMHTDFRKQTLKQSVHDWLDTTQTGEYLKRPDSLYIPEETTPTPEMRRCCTQWGKDNYRSFENESTSGSQEAVEEFPSNCTFNISSRNKEQYSSNDISNCTSNERSQPSATLDEERQESVQDRIWRKSFYSRFNNRALSRKERSSFIEPELFSESRLGLLNNIYNPLKTGYEKPEISKWDGSNKSFNTKLSRKHSSSSFDKYESRCSLKKKHTKPEKEWETELSNEESCSHKMFAEACNIPTENEEPEH